MSEVPLQAIDTAEEAGRIALGILGDKNGRAKAIARLKGEHRKLFMKCSASGFSVQVFFFITLKPRVE